MIDAIKNLNIINPKYDPIVKISAGAVLLAAGAVFSPWESVKIIGLTVLTGASYGIANDMIACRDCIEYFTVGHIYDGLDLKCRPLKTLNPNLNAIAWGVMATWHVCAIAGTALALIARMPLPGVILKVSAVQIAPYLAIGAALTIIFAHIKSRAAQKEMEANPKTKYWDVPLNFQAKWEGCNIRNMTGYQAIGVLGAALSIAVLAARIGFFKL